MHNFLFRLSNDNTETNLSSAAANRTQTNDELQTIGQDNLVSEVDEDMEKEGGNSYSHVEQNQTTKDDRQVSFKGLLF